MAISIKNKELIYQYLKLGQDIQKAYSNMLGKTNSAHLLNLLDQEESLLQNFDFSNNSVSNVERLFEEQLSIDIKTNIPYSLGPFLTEHTYPYLRLISLLRYMERKRSKKFEQFIIPNEQDAEIALFYRSLISDSELYLKYSDVLRAIAMNTLIESPVVERAVVKNNMEPVKALDCLPFQIELWATYHVKRVSGVFQIPSQEYLLELKHKRTDLLFGENDDLMEKYMSLYNSRQISQMAYLLACVSYFKAVVAIQEPEKRETILEIFDIINARSLMDDETKKVIEYSKVDIQKMLVPTVTKVSFVYRLLKK